MATTVMAKAYPVRFSVDYPDGPRNRRTAFFRIIVVIPIAIVLGALGGGVPAQTHTGILGPSLAVALMLLFRQKYPQWWFDWILALNRFSARVTAYLVLSRDEYPSTDEEQTVHLEIDYPDATRLNRWLPLVKWLLAFPHYVVIVFLLCAGVLVTLFLWFAILITGRTPLWAFDFLVGVERLCYRVAGYALLLVTDRYPPFSLN